MAGSKKNKQIIQKEIPKGKSIAQGGDPEQYYSQNPAWTFANSDQVMWAFSQEHIGELIWTEILPRLKALETQTWSEILVRDKKRNHSLNLDDLNKIAQERLASKYIEKYKNSITSKKFLHSIHDRYFVLYKYILTFI